VTVKNAVPGEANTRVAVRATERVEPALELARLAARISPEDSNMIKILGLVMLSLAVASSCAESDPGALVSSQAPTDESAASLGVVTTSATCSSTCGALPSVSCSGTSCTAVNRNCPAGEPGYAECDGVRTSCPACQCHDGDLQQVQVTNTCCCDPDVSRPVPRRLLVETICENGVWVNRNVCEGTNCGGVCAL
jgi:hypothetical protein